MHFASVRSLTIRARIIYIFVNFVLLSFALPPRGLSLLSLVIILQHFSTMAVERSVRQLRATVPSERPRDGWGPLDDAMSDGSSKAKHQGKWRQEWWLRS